MYRCGALTAICIFVRRLATPCRWSDLEEKFGMHSSALSEIFREVAHCFYDGKRHLIMNFRHDLLRSRASLYSQSIIDSGGAAPHCFGFLDGTKFKIC